MCMLALGNSQKLTLSLSDIMMAAVWYGRGDAVEDGVYTAGQNETILEGGAAQQRQRRKTIGCSRVGGRRGGLHDTQCQWWLHGC